LLFGLVAIVWGITRRAWSLIALGVCGILFTCLAYGALFYFAMFQRGGIYDKLSGGKTLNRYLFGNAVVLETPFPPPLDLNRAIWPCHSTYELKHSVAKKWTHNWTSHFRPFIRILLVRSLPMPCLLSLPDALSRPLLDPLLPTPSPWERIRRRWKRLADKATSAQPVAGPEANVRVVFSERSHLSGVSVRVDPGGCEQGAITLELHAVDSDGVHPLRSAAIDIATLEAGELEHLYWEPLEMSKRRFFFLRARLSRDSMQPAMSPVSLLLEAKLIHSQPQGYASLPQAVLYSPVSQCNLNLHALHFAAHARETAVRLAAHLGCRLAGDTRRKVRAPGHRLQRRHPVQ
jgi:hypothetical protein